MKRRKKSKYKKLSTYMNTCLECVRKHDREAFMKAHKDVINSLRRIFDSGADSRIRHAHKQLREFRKDVKKIYRREERPCPFI